MIDRSLRILPGLCLALGALTAIGASCQRPARPVPPIASTADDVTLCAHLAAICSVGASAACPASLARLRTLEVVPAACLADAGTMAGVQACGWECGP